MHSRFELRHVVAHHMVPFVEAIGVHETGDFPRTPSEDDVVDDCCLVLQAQRVADGQGEQDVSEVGVHSQNIITHISNLTAYNFALLVF